MNICAHCQFVKFPTTSSPGVLSLEQLKAKYFYCTAFQDTFYENPVTGSGEGNELNKCWMLNPSGKCTKFVQHQIYKRKKN